MRAMQGFNVSNVVVEDVVRAFVALKDMPHMTICSLFLWLLFLWISHYTTPNIAISVGCEFPTMLSEPQ